jgi:SPX domain protein involved in polyphosphate accumulation
MSLTPGIKRVEERFIVPEDTAVALRDYVQGHLDVDKHSAGKSNPSYEVHSFYFDSDDLQLYWRYINDAENQLSLRLRYYGDNPETVIFLETKHRLKNCYVKERVGIKSSAAAALSPAEDLDQRVLISRNRNHVLALERFTRIVRDLNAKPKVYVAFSREAYRAANTSINFDRLVRAEPASSIELSNEMRHPIFVWNQDVVVEFKFVDKEPKLFKEIVYAFGLRSCDVEKYVDAVALLGESRLRN